MVSHKFMGIVKQTGETNVNVPVNIELVFDGETDPFAVQLIISVPGEEAVVWHFSRNLLNSGASSYLPVGYGDVKFRFQGDELLMCLKNQTGHADIALPQAQVLEFLEDTFEEVEVGEEDAACHIDDLIEEILRS